MPSIVMRRALLGGHVVGVEADVVLPDVEGHRGLTRRIAPDARNRQLNHEASARRQVAGRVAEAGDLLGLRPQVPILFQTRYTSANCPGIVLVAMSPTTAGMSVRFLRSWSAIGCESSMPLTETPRLTNGMATRPVPMANSSAAPSPARSARKRTAGSSTTGANMNAEVSS